MPIQVCVMTSAHPTLDVRIFHKECRSLARGGYAVTLIAPAEADREVDGIHLRAFPIYRNRMKRFLFGAVTMYRLAMNAGADIYHFHDPELIPIALLLRARGKKVVYDVHEDLPKTVSYKAYVPKWLRVPLQMILKVVEDLASGAMSGLICATTPIAERFLKVAYRAVVHNYPLLREFPTDSAATDPEAGDYIAYVGARITLGRGAMEMVQAMSLMPADLKIRLKIAGAFDPPQLPEILSKLTGWNRIQALGVLGRAEVAELLEHARGGLVLLHPEPNYLNAQPVKLFEYMGAGIPVIASDFPVWRNIVETAGCGLLVNPLDPKTIGEAIEYLWSHPSEASEMGRRGRKAVETQYNWEREEKRLLQFYNRLTGVQADATPAHIEAPA
ncbi:MAG: glycosyltransferase family 4 protein [Candidatus Acidiferrales bacterium]